MTNRMNLTLPSPEEMAQFYTDHEKRLFPVTGSYISFADDDKRVGCCAVTVLWLMTFPRLPGDLHFPVDFLKSAIADRLDSFGLTHDARRDYHSGYRWRGSSVSVRSQKAAWSRLREYYRGVRWPIRVFNSDARMIGIATSQLLVARGLMPLLPETFDPANGVGGSCSKSFKH